MHKALLKMWDLTADILRGGESVVQTVSTSDVLHVSQYIQQSSVVLQSPLPRGVQSFCQMIAFYLIRDSVNFCFWYGCGSIRPNGANSGALQELLSDVFVDSEEQLFEYEQKLLSQTQEGCNDEVWSILVDKFKRRLVEARWPMIRERFECLDELVGSGVIRCILQIFALHGPLSITPTNILDILMDGCPRYYTSDLFLKRASLVIQEIYKADRQHFKLLNDREWRHELHHFPVPVDYHLPNVARYHNWIRYSPSLSEKIYRRQILVSGSYEEVLIRAATAHVCHALVNCSNYLTPVEIDQWMFDKRKEVDTPFHLTVTTDY